MVDAVDSIIHDLILQLVKSDKAYQDSGISRLTVTGNIYQVSRELGHSKTTTTEIYLEYPEQRRLDDFPSLSKYIKRYDILEENRIKDTVYKDTGRYNFLYSPREIDNL